MFFRYYYSDKKNKRQSVLIEGATRRQADAKFVAVTGCFEADKIEPVSEPQLKSKS